MINYIIKWCAYEYIRENYEFYLNKTKRYILRIRMKKK